MLLLSRGIPVKFKAAQKEGQVTAFVSRKPQKTHKFENQYKLYERRIPLEELLKLVEEHY